MIKKGNSIEGGLTSAGRHFSCEGLVAAPGAFLIGDGFSQTRKLFVVFRFPLLFLLNSSGCEAHDKLLLSTVLDPRFDIFNIIL